MTNPKTPAKLYRDSVRSLFVLYRDPPNGDPELAFHTQLEHVYAECKRHLKQLIDTKAPPKQIQAERTGLFIAAVGLFTYGHLDVVVDILEHIPTSKADIRLLARSIKLLLPLPEGLDPLADPEAVRNWFLAMDGKLKWHSGTGKYEVS